MRGGGSVLSIVVPTRVTGKKQGISRRMLNPLSFSLTETLSFHRESEQGVERIISDANKSSKRNNERYIIARIVRIITEIY